MKTINKLVKRLNRRERLMEAMSRSYFRVKLICSVRTSESVRRLGNEVRAQVRIIRLLRGGSPWKRAEYGS